MNTGAILTATIVTVLATTAVCLTGEENLARNPGFEVLNADGTLVDWPHKPPVYSVSKQSPRTGNQCLRWENKNPGNYVLLGQGIPLKPGCRYEFGVWVRTEDIKGEGTGATVCLEWLGKGHRFIGGEYPPGIKGTSGGWQYVKGLTGPVPDDAQHFAVTCYVRRGGTGVAYFDDLTVRQYFPPLVGTVITDCYRNQCEGGPVRVYTGLELNAHGLTPTDVTAAVQIVATDGVTTLRARNVTVTDDQLTAELDTSGLVPGRYRIACDVRARDGSLLGRGECGLVKVERTAARKAYIDRHQRLILDGQPFFPLGTYWAGVSTNDLDIYADSKFNCLMPYASIDRRALDEAEKRGIHVIYSVKDLYAGWHGLKDEAAAQAAIRKTVGTLRDHPAIMAWYINDELPATMMPDLTAHRELLEELDPGRPTWVVLFQLEQVRDYLPTFDVIGTDPYPIPAKPVSMVRQFACDTVDAVFGARAVWMVPQIFNWGSYKNTREEKRKQRAPTLAEMRCMAWQCIASGANGLVFYSWFDLWRMNRTVDEGGGAIVRDPFDERWRDVRVMANEIADLIPVLLSTEAPADIRMKTGEEEIVHRLYGVGKKTVLVAVNSSDEAAEAIFSMPAGLAPGKLLLGSAIPAVKGGDLCLRLRRWEVVVLELSSPE